MNTKKYIKLYSLIGALLLMAHPSSAAGIYNNNASALNINALTDTFATFAHNGEQLSDLFKSNSLYGTMTRIDEYGDDGSTLPRNSFEQNSDFIFNNVWADVKHINGHFHYDDAASPRGRFNMATLGVTTKSIDLKYGDIYFGGFAGYINSDIAHINTNGDHAGIFANYRLNKFDVTALTNIGSLNNNAENADFNNSWVNVASDASVRINLDDTFIMRPALYIGYTFVTSDDLLVNNDVVTSKDFNFLNITPSVSFIKEISKNWYGALSAKYVAHFGGDNKIYVANVKTDGIELDNHTDIGLDLEHNFKHFVFGGKIHKQIGGIDGWSGDINIKYVF